MSNNNRVRAINAIADTPIPTLSQGGTVSFDDYAQNVFNGKAIRRYLPQAAAKKLLATIRGAEPLDPSIAEDVANAMKEWAIARGATHYTHWFQPLTGGTAEKHDAFLELNERGGAIMAFSGKNLIMGEPDASSFPSGGLRCTFEARGYTAWDPKSPAFIKRHSNGATLCIPTVFCSYTGEVLDKKTPLLRSIQALEKSVQRLMKCFGKKSEPVTVTLGAEQEYFLIDRRFYLHRPDLIQSGRTLFGSPPAKHQQLEDHYFGAIRPRILAFMTEVEEELWKLGIPAKTRHNEVAPAQFELAPIFEEQNLSVDHNMLTMEILRQTAERHSLVCLLHEKPFAGVNGSGKHNNWSVAFGKKNLLDPGDNPHENAIFLTVLAAILRAVDLHGDLMRAASAGAGNEHRLGANEAPPAIMSVFLGEQLSDVIAQLEEGSATKSRRAESMRIGVDSLPPLPRDATDRNRTSPFAFTGNKFEFRALGSSQSCAGVNMILNTIVAESLDYVSDRLEKFEKSDFNASLALLLREMIKKHKKIVFNGNNYGAQWLDEAQKRGLPNLHATMDGLRPLLESKNQTLFDRYGVLTKEEMASRFEVFLEEYHRKIRIEGEIALEIARSMILPTAAGEYRRALETVAMARQAKQPTQGIAATATGIGELLEALIVRADRLEKTLKRPHEEILAAMSSLRETVDALEQTLDDAVWPLPKYREMLFMY